MADTRLDVMRGNRESKNFIYLIRSHVLVYELLLLFAGVKYIIDSP